MRRSLFNNLQDLLCHMYMVYVVKDICVCIAPETSLSHVIVVL